MTEKQPYALRERIRIEHEIVTQAVKECLEAGYSISIDNGGGDEDIELENCSDLAIIKKHLFLTDEERIYCIKDGKTLGWIFCVYGNEGWEVINDYSTNLESVLVETNKLIDKYQ